MNYPQIRDGLRCLSCIFLDVARTPVPDFDPKCTQLHQDAGGKLFSAQAGIRLKFKDSMEFERRVGVYVLMMGISQGRILPAGI